MQQLICLWVLKFFLCIDKRQTGFSGELKDSRTQCLFMVDSDFISCLSLSFINWLKKKYNLVIKQTLLLWVILCVHGAKKWYLCRRKCLLHNLKNLDILHSPCFVLFCWFFFLLGSVYRWTCDWSKSEWKIQRCLNHFTHNLGQALQLAPTREK